MRLWETNWNGTLTSFVLSSGDETWTDAHEENSFGLVGIVIFDD